MGPEKLPRGAYSSPKKTMVGRAMGSAKKPRSPRSPRGAAKGSPRAKSKAAAAAAAMAAEIKITPNMYASATSLRHFVKNPSAIRWCIFEHFYSSIDRSLLKEADPFRRILKETFPQIAEVESLTQHEWLHVRRAMGKPRRFSPRFIRSERQQLDHQRDLVRLLQQGIQPSADGTELGPNIPLPLSIGRRVLALSSPVPNGPEGVVFPGYVLGICSVDKAYRVKFDASALGVQTVADTDLAPVSEADQPATILVDVLLKERVHVPSAGVTERLVKLLPWQFVADVAGANWRGASRRVFAKRRPGPTTPPACKAPSVLSNLPKKC
jgi:hypothetical protein